MSDVTYRSPYVVEGVGANGPLGLNALACTTALRARQLEPLGTPFRDVRGETFGVGRALSLGDLRGDERLVALGAPALRECIGRSVPKAGVSLFLATERATDAGARGEDGAFLARLAASSGVPIDAARSRIVRKGHAGFAFALALGMRALLEGTRDVVCGGLASPYDEDFLRDLDARGSLLHGDRPDGRVPSEAAAFVRISTREVRGKGAAKARINGVETVDDASDERILGKLLVRLAAPEGAGPIEWLVSDLNGENARTEAWLDAERAAGSVLLGVPHDEPVAHAGDTGAATGALLFVIVHELARIGAVHAARAHLALRSDGPERAAIALLLPEADGELRASRGAPVSRTLRASGQGTLAVAEHAQASRLSRSCLEDIGSMGLLLAPDAVDEGRHPAALAQRALDNLDALVAPALPKAGARHVADLRDILTAYFAEVDAPDRARRFAQGFVTNHVRWSRSKVPGRTD